MQIWSAVLTIPPQSFRFHRVTSQCLIRPAIGTAAVSVFSLESGWFLKHLHHGYLHLVWFIFIINNTSPPPPPINPMLSPFKPSPSPHPPPDNESSSSFTLKLISILFLLLHLQFGFHSGVLHTPTKYPSAPILLYFLQANGTIMEPWVWSEVCSLFPLTNTQNSRRKMNFSLVRLWSLTLVLHLGKKKKKTLFKWEKKSQPAWREVMLKEWKIAFTGLNWFCSCLPWITAGFCLWMFQELNCCFYLLLFIQHTHSYNSTLLWMLINWPISFLLHFKSWIVEPF